MQYSVKYFFFMGMLYKCAHFLQASLWTSGENRKSFNCSVASRLGVHMFDAAVDFRDKDYEKVFSKLWPVR